MGGIEIRGARQHNLRSVDLDLPHRRLIVFCGPSGSGKSSMAFDTLHAEAQRRYVDVLALHSRGLERGLNRPDVDEISGLPPTVALDQRFRAPASQATVGTWTEAHAVLAVLFSRCGVQHCPDCDRAIIPQTHDDIVRALLALPEGTRLHVEAPVPGDALLVLPELVRAGFSRVRINDVVQRVEEVDKRVLEGQQLRVVVDRLKVGPDRSDRLHDAVRLASRAGQGAIVAVAPDQTLTFVDRPWCMHDNRTFPALNPRLFSLHGEGRCPACAATGVTGGGVCSDCGGSRLGAVARAVRFGGLSMPDLLAKPMPELVNWLAKAPRGPVSTRPIEALQRRAAQLRGLGLTLPLGRGCATLSSGELQRLRLARQVAERLSGVLYVLDEPAAGLDAAAVPAVAALLRTLVDQGNTVLAVSHREAIVRAADLLVEFGPGAGIDGGRVVAEGGAPALVQAQTATGTWLQGGLDTSPPGAGVTSHVVFGDLVLPHRTLSLSLPWGGLGVLSGASGTGKTLALAAIHALGRRQLDDAGEAPVVGSVSGLDGLSRMVLLSTKTGRIRRSNPATWSGLWDVMRPLLAATREAQVRGLGASQFSLNQAGGRCEACKGSGQQRVDLQLLADVYLPCPTCSGRRFAADILEVRWKGRNASEILEMRVAEAQLFLAGHPKLEAALRSLADVGLGYLPLGQPAHTLSGGETQRMRLARELGRSRKSGLKGSLYLLDGPSRGLHPADTVQLIGVLRRLIEQGATVWVASHDALLCNAADGVALLEGADLGTSATVML
jgi:excinuclease ABC subunit A